MKNFFRKILNNKPFLLILLINFFVLSLGLGATLIYLLLRPGTVTSISEPVQEGIIPMTTVRFNINLRESSFTIVNLLDFSQPPVDVYPVYSDVLDSTEIQLEPGVYKVIFIEEGGIDTETIFYVLADQIEVEVNLKESEEFGIENAEPSLTPVEPGTFVHPLGTDPGCGGWTWSRGFTSYHKGVDMAKPGGCWINAAGDGEVITAGWGDSGEGFNVIIDHGNGILTKYYNGDSQFKVKVGDQVQAGQEIMYLGCSGNCYGDHLHFEVVLNGVRVNPEDYVRLR